MKIDVGELEEIAADGLRLVKSLDAPPGGPSREHFEMVLPMLAEREVHRLVLRCRRAFLRKYEKGIEEDWARRDPRDLLGWGQEYLPEHFSKTPSGMHRWLAEKLAGMEERRGSKLNVLGPRGAAKSTVATLAYPLRAALEAREPYIWIVSDTAHQARAHLENLKQEIVENPRLAAFYRGSAGRGPVWRAGAIVLRNGVTVEAFGTGQRVRGHRRRHHRPTLIVCDDLPELSQIFADFRLNRGVCVRTVQEVTRSGGLLERRVPHVYNNAEFVGGDFAVLVACLHTTQFSSPSFGVPGLDHVSGQANGISCV